ncbi:MAG TPA: reverse transcriptase-like protein, partial [Solirubrobacterales bacterium]
MEKLIVNVDGGARGNPGPAAVGAVVRGADGEVLEERGERIGVATNNVAEYRALLLGIERASALGAAELELLGDSELVVRQVRGEYKVKDANLRQLHAEVKRALSDFECWSIRHVPRAENAEADRLVNRVLDGDVDPGESAKPAASAAAEGDAIDPGADIGHVHLKVADLDRALAFYSGILGFELTTRMGSQAAFLSAGGYHHHLGLNTWES